MQRDENKQSRPENVILFEESARLQELKKQAEIEHLKELYSITKNGTLKKYKGSERVVTIPEGVTRIGCQAFESNAFIENVILSETVEVIEESAFKYCNHLKRAVLPSCLKQIEQYAFFHCEELEDIVLPDSLTDIGAFAFSHCSKLREIRIPEKVRELPWQILSECTELQVVYIDKNVERIEDLAFIGSGPSITVAEENAWFCSKDGSLYTKDMQTLLHGCVANNTFVFLETVRKIAPYAFCGAKELYDICIPASVKEVGYNAFASSGLKVVQFAEEGVYTLGSELFYGCSELKTVLLPKTLLEIPSAFFWYCRKLDEIRLPKGMRKIGSYAFRDTGLKKISIPDSVAEISHDAFDVKTQFERIPDLPIARQIDRRNRAYYLLFETNMKGPYRFEEDEVDQITVRDKVFVIGGIRGKQKKIVVEEIEQLGGICTTKLSEEIDYLIIEPFPNPPSVYDKALELRMSEKNKKLQILSIQSYNRLIGMLTNTSTRYGYRIQPRKEETLSPEIFDSKCGGQPYWDLSRQFPKDAEGQEMALLAQINLDKLGENTFGDLPQKGMLQFFISANAALYSKSYKVIYHEMIDYSYEPEGYCPELDDIFPMGELAVELKYVEDTRRTKDYYIGSWLLGYRGRTINHHPVYEDIESRKKYNQLLFQLDSMKVSYYGNRRTAICINDEGFISFHINATAMKSGDFTDTYLHTDSF